MPAKNEPSLSKTERAAALRATRRAAQEAKALRANLQRRKQQARSRASELESRPDAGGEAKPAGKLHQAAEETPKCR